MPQHYYIYNSFGKQIIKHILEFENLREDFNKLMKQYDLNILLNKHVNSNKKVYSVDDLTNETKKLIQQVYHYDFVKFGYKK